MVITFYEAMIDSQLHKINYKTLLECFLHDRALLFWCPLTPFFGEGVHYQGIPSVLPPLLCIPWYLSH